ncbi:hypothetical protein MRB53_037511 [Persea americana]|nr:hypothetical protein MRB53_037511 [Persea americana]
MDDTAAAWLVMCKLKKTKGGGWSATGCSSLRIVSRQEKRWATDTRSCEAISREACSMRRIAWTILLEIRPAGHRNTLPRRCRRRLRHCRRC